MGLVFAHYKLFVVSVMALFAACFVWGQDNAPPVVTADGDAIHCPFSKTPIVSFFDITDPDDTQIDAFFVQISEGYQRGFDGLSLRGAHPNVATSWDVAQGKLTLTGPGGGPVAYTDLIAAIYDMVFESGAITLTETKGFSFTIGEANYLPQTGHYYEYVPSAGITWSAARDAAEQRTFFGLKGYLATITSREEAVFAGGQTSGFGWIGGSDEAQEGVWRWMTGPEAGTVFWNGEVNGTSPNFAFWNTAEPNNFNEEDYAHVTSPNVGVPGTWNDLSNQGAPFGVYQPKGYIVEYGGFADDPVLQLSASTTLRVPKIVATTGATGCGASSLQLTATATIGEVFWFDAPEGGNLLHTGNSYTTPVLTEDSTFYALAAVNGCTLGPRTAVVASIGPLPQIAATFVFNNCDADGTPDGIVDFNLNEATPFLTKGDTRLSVTYHLTAQNAQNAIDPIPANAFSNAAANRVYARISNSFDCFLVATVDLGVSTTALPTALITEIAVCDADEPDGFYEFDLTVAANRLLATLPPGQNLNVSFYRTQENALLETEAIVTNTPFRNETAFLQTLYVRVESETNGSCIGIGPHLSLRVYPLVDVELPPDVTVCEGVAKTVSVQDPQPNYSYQWFGPNGGLISTASSAQISTGDSYQVQAMSADGCISEMQTLVVGASSAPDLNLEVLGVVQENGKANIVVQANQLGLGVYHFALDDPFGPYQEDPVFKAVPPGLHTVYAVDTLGCGTASQEVGVLGLPNFMSPNADGHNDGFSVLGLTPEMYQKATLSIFDRYGKLLAQLDGFTSVWDGNHQNRPMPAADYWYVLDLIPHKGVQQRVSGHFALMR